MTPGAWWLQAAAKVRNIRQLPHLYSQLGQLLDGTNSLPALPAKPLATIAHLQAIGQQPRVAG